MGLLDKVRDKFPMIEDDEEFEEEFDEVYEEKQAAKKAAAKKEPTRAAGVSQDQVILVKPEGFSDVSGIAEHLVARKTVVLNLEFVNKETTRRLIDFLGGVAFAMDGQVKKVSNCTYIVTPKNVDFVSELVDDSDYNQSDVY